jgi:hypothetical protein
MAFAALGGLLAGGSVFQGHIQDVVRSKVV